MLLQLTLIFYRMRVILIRLQKLRILWDITKKSEKVKWQKLREQLAKVRTQKAIDVFELVYQTGLVPIPPKLDG